MDLTYCSCGIKHRQLFNDVFSCPRCPTIIVKKDHVTMTWIGDTALVLLDEFEKHVTKVLLARRHEAAVDMGAEVRPIACAPKAPEKPTQPCELCNSPMEAGCGKKCPNCKWISPCSLG